MHITASTDIGNIRTQNQDRYGVWKINYDECLAIVADGMGGHSYGDVASEIVIDTIYDNFVREKNQTPNFKCHINYILSESMDLANEKILKFVDQNRIEGMVGSTAVVCYIQDKHIHIAHVGDSRAYLIRNDVITRLTVDHSLNESDPNAGKNIITKAVGTEVDKKYIADLSNFELKDEDYIILCTDGLTNELSDSEILETIKLEKNNRDNKIVDKLMETTKNKGARDNVTIVLIHIA